MRRYTGGYDGGGAGDGNAVMLLPAGAMGGAQRVPMFGGGEMSGQAAHNFEVKLRVAATAFQNSGTGFHNRKTVAEVCQFIMSHMEAGGAAYTWGQQIEGPLRRRFINFAQRYLMEAHDLVYAERCQNFALKMSWEDLSYRDPVTEVSLADILRESQVEYLRQNEYLLDGPPVEPAAEGAGAQQSRVAIERELYRRARRQVDKATRADAVAPSGRPPYHRPILPHLEPGAAGGAAQPLAPRQPRLLAELPWEVEGPYQKTLDKLQEYEAERLADRLSPAIPGFAGYSCDAFKGEFVVCTGEELRELQRMTPKEGDAPLVYRTKLMGAWNRAGGEKKWPEVMLIDTYLKGLMIGYPIPVHNAVQRVIEGKFNNQKQKISIVRDLCHVATAAYEGLGEVAARKLEVQSQMRGGGQAGSGGRYQGGGQGAGGSRGVQQYGQSSRQRSAHAVFTYDLEEPYYQAYATQHTRTMPHSYNAVPPPPRHQPQFHQGGSGGRSSCRTCGGDHPGICFVEHPEQAHASWLGPLSQEAYIVYVENCAKAKPSPLQPVRYMFKVVGDWPKHVKDYINKMGVREPERRSLGQQPRQWSQGHTGQPRQQERQSGLGSSYLAQVSGRDSHYPSLEESFRSGTMLHDEEADEDAYYSCWHAQSVLEHEPAEAFVSTTRAGSKLLKAVAERTARRQQAAAPTAGNGGESSSGRAATKGSPTTVEGQKISEQGGSRRPHAAVGADRPPLPAPVAARQPPARVPGAASASNPTSAVSPTEEPGDMPEAPRALPGGRPPPLPFTVNPIPAGTPPALYPQSVPRFGKAAGTQQQMAVPRGNIVQNLPVCVSLRHLARQLPGEALKQLLVRPDLELTLLQHSLVQGGIKSSDVAVNFSNIAEVMRVAQVPQAFAAETLDGTSFQGLSKDVESLQGTDAGSGQEVKHAAWDAVASEQLQVSLQVSTMCAAEQAAEQAMGQLQSLEPCTSSRPTAYRLLAEAAETPGVTISICDSEGNTKELEGLQCLILDSGADITLMGEDCAQRSKAPMIPSDRRIRTSSGQVTGMLSKVAAPVKYVLRQGGPGECVVYQDTYVMPGSGGMYDFLLGTPLINKWGMFVDPISSIATYRPRWHSQKDSHTLAHIPALTSVEEPASRETSGAGNRAQSGNGRGQQARAKQQSTVAAAGMAGKLAVAGCKVSEDTVAVDSVISQPAAECSGTAVYEPPTTFMIMSV